LPIEDVVTFVAALTGNRECLKVGFGTEGGGLFSGRLGIPSVVCGPGSIDPRLSGWRASDAHPPQSSAVWKTSIVADRN